MATRTTSLKTTKGIYLKAKNLPPLRIFKRISKLAIRPLSENGISRMFYYY